MKGFLWSRKSSTSSSSRQDSNNSKENRKSSGQLLNVPHASSNHTTTNNHNNNGELTTSLSSSSLSSLSHGHGLSQLLSSSRSHTNVDSSTSPKVSRNHKTASLSSSSSTRNLHSHTSNNHNSSSRKSSIISRETYLRNNSSQPTMSITRKNTNPNINVKSSSLINLKNNHSTNSLTSQDSGISSNADLVSNHSVEINNNVVRITDRQSKNPMNPDLLNALSLDSNQNINVTEQNARDAEIDLNLLTRLNDSNYDSTVFKSGWLNRSHGQMTINNPYYHNSNNNNSSSSINLSTENSNSKRESRMFGHNGSTDLLISNPSTLSDSDMITSDNDTLNDKDSIQHQPQQIVVPDYRLYRAQLKGSLFCLYKNGIGNNIKCFDPNLSQSSSLSSQSFKEEDPASQELHITRTNSTLDDSDNNDSTVNSPSNNNNNKRATISVTSSLSTFTLNNNVNRSNSNHMSRKGSNVSKVSSDLSFTSNKEVTILYLNSQFPHPDLTIDEHTGKIVNGSLESLCHTILFYDGSTSRDSTPTPPSSSLLHINIYNLLLMLPLIDHFIKFLALFNQFGLTFTKNKFKVNMNSTQYHQITNETDDMITERLALVVKTILDVFPGFLLNDEIFQATIVLLDTISLHNDEISNNLKIAVANKHNDLNKLTKFIRPNSTDKNGAPWKLNSKLMNDVVDINKFLLLDTKTFANEIHHINLKFDQIWAPRFDYSLLYSSKYINTDIVTLNPLVFNNNDNIHFLGRLLISHLFPSHRNNNNINHKSRFNTDARARAKVLVKWVQLGCRLEHLGDMVSWLTIATIICSVPILRLSQSWQYVPESILKIIFKDWVPTIVQLDRRQMSSKSTSSVFILAPPNLEDPYIRENVISYFGDLLVIADDLPSDSTLKYIEKKITRTKNAFHKWQQRLESIDTEIAKRGISIDKSNSDTNNIDPINSPLYQFWKYHISQPKLNIKKIMEVSLEYEPPLVNQQSYSAIGSHRSALLTGSYLPIVFNEILPNYSLFPRSSLIGAAGSLVNKNSNSSNKLPPPRSSARLSKALLISEPIVSNQQLTLDFDSNPITGVENIDGPLLKELMASQSTKQILMKSIRDVFNIDMDMFHISNNLIFKTSMETTETSKHSSIVLESPRRFSQHSPKLNPRDSIETTGRLSKTLENMDFFKDSSNSTDPLKASIINVVVKSATLDKLFDLLVLTAGIFSKLIDTKDLENYCYHQQRNSTSDQAVGLLDFALAKLAMDNDTFTETFFNTYKSFTSTLTVLENLAKRFIGAKSCAQSVCKVLDSDEVSVDNEVKFPVWDSNVSEEEDVKYDYMIKIQIGTAEAILHLITDHYTDFTDDMNCHTTVLDILKIMEQEVIVEWPKRIDILKERAQGDQEEISELEMLSTQFSSLFNNIRSHYQKQLYRPVGVSKMKKKIIEQLSDFKTFTFNEFNDILNEGNPSHGLITDFKLLSYKDYNGIFKWVSTVDKIFTDVFTLSTKQDWITTYEYLELLSKDSMTAFFSYPLHDTSISLIHAGSSQLKDMQISNIFNWISTLTDKNDEPVIHKLPRTVQMILTLHHSLTNFFIAEIVDINKKVEERVATCTLVLQILNYARWKNTSLDLFNSESDGDIYPHVPSFIESAICNSIISAESRYFEYAWSLGGYKLSPPDNKKQGKSIKEIMDCIDPIHIRGFLEIDNIYTGKISRNFCPCPGWFISRLLDISQFVPNMDTSNSKLINFDKRRFVNNIVSNVFNLVPNSSKMGSYNKIDTFRTGWAGVLFNQIEEPKNALKRRVKNIAQEESNIVTFNEIGLFNRIVSNEVDKIRREDKKLDLLKSQETDNKLQQTLVTNSNLIGNKRITIANHSLQTSASSNFASSHLNSTSTNKSKRNSVLPNSSRGNSVSGHSSGSVSKKIGGFFKRPFSIAGFNTSVSNYSLNSSLSQEVTSRKTIQPGLLPAIENNELLGLKPTLTLKTFEIKNIMEIINHKNNASYIYSFKIIMQDGNEYMIQTKNARDLNEWVRMIKASKRYSFYSQKFGGKTHNKVFGVPLESICQREGTLIPTIIIKLLEEIELRGLDEVGLYRIPGSVGSINALKNAFDEEGAINTTFSLDDDRWFEINAIAGCFKMYLRELPDSLFSTHLDEFANLVLGYKSNTISYDQYKTKISILLSKLPPCYYHTMKRIVLHLNKVHQHVGNNRMDASNLSIVFSMSFIDQDDLAHSMGSTLGAVQTILQQFIKNPEDFFM